MADLHGNWKALFCKALAVLSLPILFSAVLLEILNPAHPKAILVVVCAGTIVAWHLLYDLRQSILPLNAKGLIAWPLTLGVLALVTMSAFGGTQADHRVVLRLCGGAAVLGYFLDQLTVLLGRESDRLRGGSFAALLVLGLATTSPLWIGVWVENGPISGSALDRLIASNPLTYLAVLAEYDYLRSQWFYRNSPFGGLRYSYPTGITASLWYLIIGGLLRLVHSTGRRLVLRRAG